MNIEKITILPGYSKDGEKEDFENIEIESGQKIGVVGPTGSGKSQLLHDLENLAWGETKTKRRILVNSEKPSREQQVHPNEKVVGALTQQMNFQSDITVRNFLEKHAGIREKHDDIDIKQVIEDANSITGEKIHGGMNLLMLSGGQSRALMVADVAHVSESPIILVDEIENAGIRIDSALNLLVKKGKIIFLVTHAPTLALNTDMRLVLENGGISSIMTTSAKERGVASYLSWIDDYVLDARERVRSGERVEELKIVCTPLG